MDAYKLFMESFGINKDDLFEWGIKNTVFPSAAKVSEEWKDLLYRIHNDQEVYIRAYGRNGHNTEIYRSFYKFLLGNEHVKADPTNNAKPKSIIESMTGFKRNKNIFNYQTSHIWGHTKNIFLFEAPWNICYVTKIMDPFTGHEAKGTYISEYQLRFRKEAFGLYKDYIEEYNYIIQNLSIREKINQYSQTLTEAYNKKQIHQFVEDCLNEFTVITE